MKPVSLPPRARCAEKLRQQIAMLEVAILATQGDVDSGNLRGLMRAAANLRIHRWKLCLLGLQKTLAVLRETQQ